MAEKETSPNVGVLEEAPKSVPLNPQSQRDQQISMRVWDAFDKYRRNRNLSFSFFRERTPIEYWNDSDMRFNNYRIKPAWKDEWQANISDITTHAKLMAIVANVVGNNYKPVFESRKGFTIASQIKAMILGNIYEYTDTEIRNGYLDLLFTTIKAARQGTVIGFEGWKKTTLSEGTDAVIIPLEDFYPADIGIFDINEQLKCVWRSVITKDKFDDEYSGWYNKEKVNVKMNMGSEEATFFNISMDVLDDQVELLRYFDLINDEYFVIANGILIIDPKSAGAKLSNRRSDKRMGFWKVVYEPIDDHFFYGRSLPDLMRDNQDAIDFLFNGMFDKEILAVMRPILVGGVNQLTSDYLYPGRPIQVADINQIKEMQFEGPDLTSFKILQELQNRNMLASVDASQSGVASGRKTASEVERAQENAKKILSLFNSMVSMGIEQKAKLRTDVNIKFLMKSPEYREMIMDNIKLNFNYGIGRLVLRLKGSSKLPNRSESGFSPDLQQESQQAGGNTQIFEIDPKEFVNFKYSVKVSTASVVEQSPALKKAFTDRFLERAAASQWYPPDVLKRIDVENNKDVLGQYADDLLAEKNPQPPGAPGGAPAPGSNFMNSVTPQNQSAVPNLKSMINSPAA